VSAKLVDDPADAGPKTFGLGICSSGKFRYDTRHAADRAVRAFRRKEHAKVQVYRCDACHGWHLGSSLGGRSVGRSR
jgi:hypothetical protein